MSDQSDNMHLRAGWRPIPCAESDAIRVRSGGVRSTLTDPDGVYGPKVIYTEWGDADGNPILRDYLWRDEPCEHLVPDPERAS